MEGEARNKMILNIKLNETILIDDIMYIWYLILLNWRLLEGNHCDMKNGLLNERDESKSIYQQKMMRTMLLLVV